MGSGVTAASLHWLPVEAIEGVRPSSRRRKRVRPPRPRRSGWRSSTPTAASSACWRSASAPSAGGRRCSRSPPPVEELQALRQHAIVIDTAIARLGGVDLPGRLCASSPSPGGRRLHRPDAPSRSVCAACASEPTTGSPSRATPRRCWHESRRRCGRVRPPPSPRSRPSPSSPVSSRSGRTCSRPSSAAASLGLTRREFELLQLLAASQRPGDPAGADLRAGLGLPMAHGDRSVDVFVRKLRRKLEAASPGWRYVHTHFGVGYRFDAQEAGDDDEDSPEASASLSRRLRVSQ